MQYCLGLIIAMMGDKQGIAGFKFCGADQQSIALLPRPFLQASGGWFSHNLENAMRDIPSFAKLSHRSDLALRLRPQAVIDSCSDDNEIGKLAAKIEQGQRIRSAGNRYKNLAKRSETRGKFRTKAGAQDLRQRTSRAGVRAGRFGGWLGKPWDISVHDWSEHRRLPWPRQDCGAKFRA